MADKSDTPLSIRIAGTKASDQRQIILLVVNQYPELADRPGRRRTEPATVYADASYDSGTTRPSSVGLV